MEKPQLTPDEEKTLDAISHQLCGNTFQPVDQEKPDKPKEKSADDLTLDEAFKNIR